MSYDIVRKPFYRLFKQRRYFLPWLKYEGTSQVLSQTTIVPLFLGRDLFAAGAA